MMPNVQHASKPMVSRYIDRSTSRRLRRQESRSSSVVKKMTSPESSPFGNAQGGCGFILGNIFDVFFWYWVILYTLRYILGTS